MARYRGSVCRMCRREGLKLFFKGDRCYTEKCAFERRGYAPGEHGHSRKKFSDYGTQLREKQKLKRMFGLLEKQFRGYFVKADQKKGITGTNLLVFLESRMDNMVYRMGFAASRTEARQFVRHGHFKVNGRKVNIPSFLIKKGDVIELREKSKKVLPILESMETVARRGIPPWLELDKENFRGIVKALPTRDDITIPLKFSLSSSSHGEFQ
ncbi:MAG TPA: 30S ribosomal protein S4, partial [Syntrophales bacterium]|nr:30S ribosomal protein S4 [Syntrophales bacterium]